MGYSVVKRPPRPDHATPLEAYSAFRASMLAKSEAWKDLLSEDVELKGPLATGHGRTDFVAINAPFFASMKGSVLHEAVDFGDKVITRISTTVATPAGGDVTLDVSEWYTWKEGLLVDLKVFFDSTALAEAMGA